MSWRDLEHRALVVAAQLGDCSGKRARLVAARQCKSHGVGQRHHAGNAGGDVFADAVAHARCRLQAPRHPQPRRRVLHGEERGVGDARFAQTAQRLFASLAGRIQETAHIEAEMWPQRLGTLVDRLTKHRLASVQLDASVDDLGARIGEHEDNRAGGAVVMTAEHEPGTRLFEQARRIVQIAADDDLSMPERAAADLQRVSGVGEIQGRVAPEMRRQICRRRFEAFFRLSRERDELRGS